jgi:hypothetical protein
LTLRTALVPAGAAMSLVALRVARQARPPVIDGSDK